MKKKLIFYLLIILILVVCYAYLNYNYRELRGINKSMTYIDRYNYISENHNKINIKLSKSPIDKEELINLLGVPYNKIDDKCWIWLEPSGNDKLGDPLKECNYGRGGFFLDLEPQGNAELRLRSIAGNWENFQEILQR